MMKSNAKKKEIVANPIMYYTVACVNKTKQQRDKLPKRLAKAL